MTCENLLKSKNKKRFSIRKAFFGVFWTLFLISVPFAMWYNINYDKYGEVFDTPQQITITIHAIDTSPYNNTFRRYSAEYSTKNQGVKIIIIPLTGEQSNPTHADIKIVREVTQTPEHQNSQSNNSQSATPPTPITTIHAFISQNIPSHVLNHANGFIEFLINQTELNIQTHAS